MSIQPSQILPKVIENEHNVMIKIGPKVTS